MTHTPTPWRISKQYDPEKGHDDHTPLIKSADNTTVAVVPLPGNSWEVHQANAAYIVQAVNSYEGLIEALRLLRDYPDLSNRQTVIEQALKTAEGEK